MGTCGTRLTKEEREKAMVSKQIDKYAINKYKEVREAVKILLLGPGESGKSTLLKQMNNIYSTGYDEEEMRGFKLVIRNNLLDNFQTLIEMSDKLEEKGIEGTKISENGKTAKDVIMNATITETDDSVWQTICDHIDHLWKTEPGLKKTYENKSKFQLPGSGDYFINKAKEIGDPNFFPTHDDLLRARVRTTGIVEKEFEIGKTVFKVFDVGGQRNERKKWIHCFDDVKCIIFLVSLAGFDEFLYEDETVPRMREALELFDEICNSRHFKQTSIVLFLNKSDLFENKIKTTPLTVLFDDFTGNTKDFNETTEFIKNKFLELNNVKNKEIYTHITCATNNDNIKHVINAVTDIFIKEKLAVGGLLY